MAFYPVLKGRTYASTRENSNASRARRLSSRESTLVESKEACGENGEFHTFVADAPYFDYPVAVEVGEVVYRDPFWFADLLGK